jgi:hypothetical protein
VLHVWQHVNLLPLLCVLQVHQLKGERSFHIFYQLVRGAGRDKGLKAELRLPNKPNDFTYLSKSGCMVRRGGFDGHLVQFRYRHVTVGWELPVFCPDALCQQSPVVTPC